MAIDGITIRIHAKVNKVVLSIRFRSCGRHDAGRSMVNSVHSDRACAATIVSLQHDT